MTIEDFCAGHGRLSERDFSQFMRWYRQAGTPQVSVSEHYDSKTITYTVAMSQQCRATAECSHKLPFLIPIKVALLGENGKLNFVHNSAAADECILDLANRRNILYLTM
ncbi:MAG: DUF3458 domain-containing protein [Rhodococcus sp. (in: high G+C Gram-positive bacteria)]|uniref:DUF3458 domain-containing protein n=1 Tax=Rhodococcus sp. TaxID=1831 RepID=UPI002AD83308|nr:DUF3458 domain-containing protein [Rhodococcus sp. (in: high G+C Gram-positive bacteria)]